AVNQRRADVDYLHPRLGPNQSQTFLCLVLGNGVRIFRFRAIIRSERPTRQGAFAVHLDGTEEHEPPYTTLGGLTRQMQSAIDINSPKLGERICRGVLNNVDARCSVNYRLGK